MFAAALALLSLLSGVLMLWQWLAAGRFPLEKRAPIVGPFPTISVLKPVKGVDPGTATALGTWLQQDYPGTVEVLLGVDAADDPAVATLEHLVAMHPSGRARLVVCPERLGVNRKVSNLRQMARLARGELVVVSDADVVAPPDLLSQLTLPFRGPGVGLVHCLYRFRLAGAPTLAMRWEALAVNADFWSQVLQNQTIKPLDYALGAAVALRRTDLDAIGGFAALGHYLADDNRLGHLVTGLGKRTELCPVVVDCRVAPAGWREVWGHQLRWAVTIRVCQGLPYFFSILANGTFWPVLWLALAPSRSAWAGALGLLGFRVVQALALEARFTRRPPDLAHAWLIPVKDLLQAALWAVAFLKRHVVWRGVRYRVLRNGRLEPA